jgi:hypothetical protein
VGGEGRSPNGPADAEVLPSNLAGSWSGELGAARGIMAEFKKLVVLMRFALLMFICGIASAAPPPSPSPSPIDITQAKAAFAEAEAVSDKEGGRLWGKKLYGSLFFVDPETRAVVANEPVLEGVLHATNGVYVGTLPQEIIVSNSPIEWQGKRWRACGAILSVRCYAVLPPSVRYFPERCSICHRKLAARRSFSARPQLNCVISVGDVK